MLYLSENKSRQTDEKNPASAGDLFLLPVACFFLLASHSYKTGMVHIHFICYEKTCQENCVDNSEFGW